MPDLILIDYRMPDCHGAELAQKIRALGPEFSQSRVPILLMSHSMFLFDVLRLHRCIAVSERDPGWQSLVNGFVSKPVRVAVLFNAVLDIFAPRHDPRSPFCFTAPREIERDRSSDRHRTRTAKNERDHGTAQTEKEIPSAGSARASPDTLSFAPAKNTTPDRRTREAADHSEGHGDRESQPRAMDSMSMLREEDKANLLRPQSEGDSWSPRGTRKVPVRPNSESTLLQESAQSPDKSTSVAGASLASEFTSALRGGRALATRGSGTSFKPNFATSHPLNILIAEDNRVNQKCVRF